MDVILLRCSTVADGGDGVSRRRNTARGGSVADVKMNFSFFCSRDGGGKSSLVTSESCTWPKDAFLLLHA